VKLSVLTFNIHKGFSFAQQRFTLPRMREAIRDSGADIVLLQEVVGASSHRSKVSRDLKIEAHFEFLADSIWPHFSYGKNAVYSKGHHGNAILSRWPLQDAKNHDVSNSKLQRRGLLHATIEIDSVQIHIICLHLDLTYRGRTAQLGRLKKLIEGSIPNEAPVIVAGDFNDWSSLISDLGPGFLEVSKVAVGRFAKTFPSWFPILPLDRIYFRGIDLRLLNISRLEGPVWQGLSDHIPLMAVFEFGEE
jgi:endonuclease/exonuclease/phosphatase family metal-dependent hydrolase